MTAIASLRGVTYRYPNATEPALRDVSLDISPGLTLVAGDSGGGKSTLLRLLNGLVPQFHGGRISGSAVVAGLDPLRTPVPEMARRVGLVFQDVETQSVYGTVEREVAFGLENLGLTRDRMRERVDEALESMSIGHLRRRRLSTLSGGERQRVQLAAVLALQPSVIALDEPTSQLDRQGAEAVLAACRSLVSDGVGRNGDSRNGDRRAVVIAEHRFGDLLRIANAFVVVEDGRVDGLNDPKRLAEAVAGAMPTTRTARATDRTESKPVFETRDLSFGPAGRSIVDGLSFSVGAGEVVAVVGSNGSGKTTLLRTIAGLLAPVSGRVERFVDRVAYVPQNPGTLLHLPTLRAEVELTARRLGVPVSADLVLETFGLATRADRYPRDLSSGERQRGALAATLAGRPQLALLDEPTRGMDLRARRSLGAVVRSMSEVGAAVVVATHDFALVAEIADRVLLLENGAARDLGGPELAFVAMGLAVGAPGLAAVAVPEPAATVPAFGEAARP